MFALIQFALILVAIFLILVVLVQRGRGGGLAGALGGMGGQSAFGTKAGDTFTKITIWTAVVWILLCVVGVKYLSSYETPADRSLPDDASASGATSRPTRAEAEEPDRKGGLPSGNTGPVGGGATKPSPPAGGAPPTTPPAKTAPPAAPADGK